MTTTDNSAIFFLDIFSWAMSIKTNNELGIVGLGDMGMLYLKQFAIAGYRINVCDLPSKYDEIRERIENCVDFDSSRVHVYRDGFGVVRRSDFIIYSVEAAYINSVVKQFAPATKLNAIVSGQTSVKEPEIKAFDEYLPVDVSVVTCHSLHGPKVSPVNQTLCVIPHRCNSEQLETALKIYECLNSKIVVLKDYIEHVSHRLFTISGQNYCKYSSRYASRIPLNGFSMEGRR
jgi:prephenate dehydrogenase (NADP+)